MTKYLVKKEFIDRDGELHKQGGGLVNQSFLMNTFWSSLIANGFIEEVKEDSRWRAKIDGEYFYIDTLSRGGMRVSDLKEGNDDYDRALHKEGNYFKSEETANKVAYALQMFFRQLHEEEWVDRSKYASEVFERFRDAQEAVLADDKRGSDEQ